MFELQFGFTSEDQTKVYTYERDRYGAKEKKRLQVEADWKEIREAEKKERAEYGRYWIWEGYFNEKIKDKWTDTADKLKHINDHILQDIEDYIILKSFGRQMKAEKIKEIIEEDHRLRITRRKKNMDEGAEEYENKALNDMTKRKFMYQLRPPFYWNFFEDGP